MRTQQEVENFRAAAFMKYVMKCRNCKGDDFSCKCRSKQEWAVSAYEACIPQDFWWSKKEDVTHNVDVFQDIVLPYVKNLKIALRKGYGLLLLGDNGVGKSYFISYILMSAIKAGRTAYYTTMPVLEKDLKKGFRNEELADRLEWLMTSDFVAIDELGKERVKNSNDFMDGQVESFLKTRLDDNMPMIIAANMDVNSLEKAYGPTVASMMSGKFQIATLTPGDFRKKIRKKMIKEMGYGG